MCVLVRGDVDEGADGWAAAKLLELAATRAAEASNSVSSATLIAALRTVRNDRLGGLVTALDFSGKTPNNANCYFVVQGDGHGGWTAPLGPAAQCN